MKGFIACVLVLLLLLLAACAAPYGSVSLDGSETPDGLGYNLVGHITVPNPQPVAGPVVFSNGWIRRHHAAGGGYRYTLTGYLVLPDGSSYRTTCKIVPAIVPTPVPTPLPPPP